MYHYNEVACCGARQIMNNSFELQVLVNGKPVKRYPHNGQVFIEARTGTEYTLRLKNNTHRRAVAIFSVDGVDVLHGKMAGDANNGYIVDTYNAIEIKGYRINDDKVAKFVFSDGKTSYAATVGATDAHGKQVRTMDNNGVIGVRVYFEEQAWTTVTWLGNTTSRPFSPPPLIPPPDTNPYWRPYWEEITCGVGGKSNASDVYCNSVYSSSAPMREMPNFRIGTGWGRAEEDRVETISFQKEKEPCFCTTIFYASRDELLAHGVELHPKKSIAQFPAPFPKTSEKSNYCKVPPNYKA